MKDMFSKQSLNIGSKIPINPIQISIGDIQISKVQDADSLARDIHNRFGNSLMQKIYQNKG